MLALLVSIAVLLTIPGQTGTGSSLKHRLASPQSISLVPRLLALTFIVSTGVGVFEIGLALRAKQELGLSQSQIAVMFTECSLVMLIVQAIVFSPWIRPEATRWLIGPAFAILAAGLSLVAYATDFTLMLVVTGAVAASAGIISPILTHWISSKAGRAQGAQLGRQTAAASLVPLSEQQQAACCLSSLVTQRFVRARHNAHSGRRHSELSPSANASSTDPRRWSRRNDCRCMRSWATMSPDGCRDRTLAVTTTLIILASKRALNQNVTTTPTMRFSAQSTIVDNSNPRSFAQADPQGSGVNAYPIASTQARWGTRVSV